MSEYSTPIMHRSPDGHLTIEWGTPGNTVSPRPVLIAPELLVEMIEEFNRTVGTS